MLIKEKVKIGLQQVAEGKTMSIADAKKRLSKWLK